MMEAKKAGVPTHYAQNYMGYAYVKNIGKLLPKEFYADEVALIRKEMKMRGITKLVHFSPYPNKDSILRNGLLSRAELRRRGMPFKFTDEKRLDGFLDAVCLSISNCNWPMLWSKYIGGAEIFELDPAILVDMPECVVYCPINAAKTGSYSQLKMGYEGFRSMFDPQKPTSPMTAIPQAEVLFFGTIPPRYIKNFYYKKKHYDR
ncbi:MAG: DUF4433 domain-containing protein [Bacilli bacterium]|nr:DUF4433 domain-containing protein [Bacilli bacterium]